MAQKQKWTGRRYGALLITAQYIGRKVDVLCDCGKSKVMDRFNLAYGRVNDCGHKFPRHGHSGSSEWKSWRHMWQRVLRPEPHQVVSYRGVSVCERWKQFENFLADMGPKPSLDYTLDRYPNKAGDYEPGNCRWATMKEQNGNRRRRGSLTTNDPAKMAKYVESARRIA